MFEHVFESLTIAKKIHNLNKNWHRQGRPEGGATGTIYPGFQLPPPPNAIKEYRITLFYFWGGGLRPPPPKRILP